MWHPCFVEEERLPCCVVKVVRRLRPRIACVSCEFSTLYRWIATTDGSALAIASAMTVSIAATMSAGEGPGGPDAA